MTPRASAAARATAPSRPARAAPTLRPVPSPRPKGASLAPRWAGVRARLSPVGIAAGVVTLCLLAVVIGNMQLAAGQLRLSQLQSQVVAVQSSEAAQQVLVQSQESPATVAHEIAVHGGLVQPSEILHLPAVSLERPLPPPSFSYAPCCSLTPGR
jgi:hypothetical protein